MNSDVNAHLVPSMRILFVLFFGMLSGAACAGDAFVPEYVVGRFERTFSVRDYGPSCQGEAEADCFYQVADEVKVKRLSQEIVHVEITTNGDNGHLCNFSGEGKWIGNGIQLTDRVSETEDLCHVFIAFENGQISTLSSEPEEPCRGFCGARAVLHSSNLRRVTE